MEGQSVIPMLSYEDVGRSADWIAEAFGFRETGRWSDEDGTVSHVNMELGGGEVMLGLPSRDYQSPRAKASGARILSEPSGGEHGRQYRVEDVEGHRWMFMAQTD